MKTKLVAHGDDYAVIIPRAALAEAGIDVSRDFDIILDQTTVPTKPPRTMKKQKQSAKHVDIQQTTEVVIKKYAKLLKKLADN